MKKRIYIYAEGDICDGMYEAFRGDSYARVVGVEKSGHFIMIDQPHRVAEILTDATVEWGTGSRLIP